MSSTDPTNVRLTPALSPTCTFCICQSILNSQSIPNSPQVKILFNFKMGSGLGSLVGSTSKSGLRGLGLGILVSDWGEGLGLGTRLRIRFRNQG